MSLSRTTEQEILAESVRTFVVRDYGLRERRDLAIAGARPQPQIWGHFADTGWLSLPIARGARRGGASWADTIVLLRELGRGLLLEPVIPTVILAGGLLARLGTGARQASHLDGSAEGSQLVATGLFEPRGRFDVTRVETRAERSPAGWVLNGLKASVWHGPSANLFLVSARTGDRPSGRDGLSLFLIPADAPGLRRRDRSWVDGHCGSELELRDVTVPESAVLGSIGGAAPELERAIDDVLVALGAEALGCMEALQERTLAHAKARRQFGKPIGSFQVVQHRLVDMFMACERVESLLIRAAIARDDAAADAGRAASALKAAVGREGRFVAQQAVQLHGGMGMADETDIGLYFKRLTAIDAQFGNAAHHLQRLAELARARV